MATIHLQGYRGKFEATEIQNVKPGQSIMWNYGVTSKVTAIEPAGKKSVRLTTVEQDGESYTVIKRKTTLVAAFD
jgi:hypothetical protein